MGNDLTALGKDIVVIEDEMGWFMHCTHTYHTFALLSEVRSRDNAQPRPRGGQGMGGKQRQKGPKSNWRDWGLIEKRERYTAIREQGKENSDGWYD